ncbi:MAG TPA: hypothetical protein VHC20_05500 [Candidatus Paceibacterota bacterium]|nr:hypothetical protein [Candidatus Paceibacterota bacterium]
MNASELRFTDTNSADDSKGRTWGLDGNLFWFLAGGAFVSVALLLFLFSVHRVAFTASAVIAGVPLTLALTYVFGFRQGKPPAYDVDCLEYWIAGKGFGPELRPQLQHPLKHGHV